MTEQHLSIRNVAVIGAGVSGVAAGIHLKRAGLDVTVYERSKRAGGIWVYDERIAKDAEYPSILPSTGDSPDYEEASKRYTQSSRPDTPMEGRDVHEHLAGEHISTSFAPPGPCYIALRNNVSTIEMEMTCQSWKDGTEEFVPHHVLADYIQDSARDNGILDAISFNTRVNQVKKSSRGWEIDVAKLKEVEGEFTVTNDTRLFDSIVIATGHYHAFNVPDIDGLSNWKRCFPDSVQHSKLYRVPDNFRNKNVLLIGAGVSSMDIARDLGPVARSVYQSSRGGMYDLPSHLLPENGARIGAIKSFDILNTKEPAQDGSIPGMITLQSGENLCGIHHVIICTGYHVSFPFMRQYHNDHVDATNADETVLVTNGQQTHNLHKDIWYIPDPTLAFVGVPYHVATFSFFEFQAMALAAVFSGRVPLPSQDEMRSEYRDRLERNGAGRNFHSLKGKGDEITYVDDLVSIVTAAGAKMARHSQKFRDAYVRRGIRQKTVFSQVRDPQLDQRVMGLLVGC